MNRRLPLLAAVLAAMLALTAAALAATSTITQTAKSGSVTATFTYKITTSKDFPTYSGERLTITRNETMAYNAPVYTKDCSPDCTPGDPRAKGHSAQIADLSGSGEPNVILTLFTGGAHCCQIAQVFTYSSSTMTYAKTEHNFEDPGFSLKKLSGAYRFESADWRFEYEFTSFAQSGVPIQIWEFTGSAFSDVTKSYPSLIRKDAAEWWKVFKANIHNGPGGVLAAWAADEELLGNDALVQKTLQTQLKAGHLTGGFVNGNAYVKLLNKDLVKFGYKK